jgi:hypothetical protein
MYFNEGREGNQKYVPRAEGEPYIMFNGLGKYFVVRQVRDEDGLHTEYAPDEDGELARLATAVVRNGIWGNDDDGLWYPVTQEIIDLEPFSEKRRASHRNREPT